MAGIRTTDDVIVGINMHQMKWWNEDTIANERLNMKEYFLVMLARSAANFIGLGKMKPVFKKCSETSFGPNFNI